MIIPQGALDIQSTEKKGGDANTPNAMRVLWMSNSPLVS